jgi:metal-responsive CopG/Arc/MetJ family transcriptional regulator
MTIRKNFTLPDDIAKQLEDMAKKRGQKQSQLIAKLIEKEAKEEDKKRKLAMIDELAGMFTGLFPDEVTIQSIKANRDDI